VLFAAFYRLSDFYGFCGASSAFALSVTFVFMAFWLLRFDFINPDY